LHTPGPHHRLIRACQDRCACAFSSWKTTPRWPRSSAAACARTGSPRTSRAPARTRCGWPARPSTTRSCSTCCYRGSTASRPAGGCARTACGPLLTARDAVEDRIAGLDGGADDYLTKPFSLGELHARLRALARRGRAPRPAILRAGDLSLDPATQRVWRGEAEIALSPRELALLEVFMRRPGEVLSRLALLDGAWDQAYENRSNVIDVYVGYLREKIDRPFGVASLETVRVRGHRLREDGGR
jgi:hypothetical protein